MWPAAGKNICGLVQGFLKKFKGFEKSSRVFSAKKKVQGFLVQGFSGSAFEKNWDIFSVIFMILRVFTCFYHFGLVFTIISKVEMGYFKK